MFAMIAHLSVNICKGAAEIVCTRVKYILPHAARQRHLCLTTVGFFLPRVPAF